MKWRPGLHFRWRDVRSFVGFGSYQMAERSLNHFSANVDFFFIGRFLGPEILAVYVLAFQIVTMPLGRINPILNRVSFPIFSRIQNDNEALRRGYLTVMKILAFAVVPLLVGLAITAPLIVRIAFGSRWSDAIPLIQILTVLGIERALVNPSPFVLLAKGRADLAFTWEVVTTVVLTSVFWFVVEYGPHAIAWAYVGWSLVDFVIGVALVRITISLNSKEYLPVLLPPVTASMLMGVTVQMAYMLLARSGANDVVLLVFLVVLGAGVYGLLCRRYLRELWVLVTGRDPTVV